MATEDKPEKEVKKSRRKLVKEVYFNDDGTSGVKIEVIGGNNGVMDFPFQSYPATIQTKLGPFGQGHKLGDAAAGRKGVEAEEAITKVNEGMLADNWSVRAPAQPKVALNVLAENFKKLSAKEQEKARPLLVALGIDIPA